MAQSIEVAVAHFERRIRKPLCAVLYGLGICSIVVDREWLVVGGFLVVMGALCSFVGASLGRQLHAMKSVSELSRGTSSLEAFTVLAKAGMKTSAIVAVVVGVVGRHLYGWPWWVVVSGLVITFCLALLFILVVGGDVRR